MKEERKAGGKEGGKAKRKRGEERRVGGRQGKEGEGEKEREEKDERFICKLPSSTSS